MGSDLHTTGDGHRMHERDQEIKIRKLELRLEKIRGLAGKVMAHPSAQRSPTWNRVYPQLMVILNGGADHGQD